MSESAGGWLLLAVWFAPAIIAMLKGGFVVGMGWAIGMVGLAMVSIAWLPLAFLWFVALIIALCRPGS
jgi:hypothetical protein